MTRASRTQRRLARRLARSAWIESSGDGDKCEMLFKNDPRLTSIDPETLLLLLQLAIRLWMWWRENNIEHPPEMPTADEPFHEGRD